MLDKEDKRAFYKAIVLFTLLVLAQAVVGLLFDIWPTGSFSYLREIFR